MPTQTTGGLRESSRFLSDTFTRALGPAILSIGGVLASTLANSLIAGNLFGHEALAVLSIVNPLYSVFATIGSLAGVGASSLAAWCIGRDDRDGCNTAVTLAAVLSLGVSALLALACLAGMEPLLDLLGAEGALRESAREYLTFYLFSGIGISGIYPPYFFLKLEGRSRLSVGLFLFLAAGCVGLELFFAAALGMGMAGIALGCSAANVVTALAGWAFLLGRGGSFRLRSPAHSGPLAGRMLRMGSPAALNNLCCVLLSVALNRMIAALAGEAGLSAFSVVSMAVNLTLILINGLGQTTGPFVGVFSSERDGVSLRQIERLAVRLGLWMSVPAAVLLAALAVPFCRLFGVSDIAALALAAPAVRLFALSLPASMLSTILMNYYLSAGRTWLANFLTVCRGYVLLAVPAKLLTPAWGLSGVWLSYTLREALTWLAVAAALAVYLRRHPELRGPLLLERRYENGQFIAFSVRSTVDEIMDASQRISGFCEENELDPQRSMMIALSLEEMLTSIREHCFPKDEEASINVRILIAPEDESGQRPVILRIRCSGRSFNPIDYYERRRARTDGELDELDELLEGLDDSLGIAMIVASAQTVDYKTTFGVNNLTILL